MMTMMTMLFMNDDNDNEDDDENDDNDDVGGGVLIKMNLWKKLKIVDENSLCNYDH